MRLAVNLRSFVTYSWKMRQGADCPAAATSSRLVVAMVETTCTGTQHLIWAVAPHEDKQWPAYSMMWAGGAARVQQLVNSRATSPKRVGSKVLLHRHMNRWWTQSALKTSGCVEQDTCGRQGRTHVAGRACMQLCQQLPESG